MGKYLVSRAYKLFLALTVGFLFPTVTLAVSIQVPSMGIKTISEAMMRSKSGDTIWVADGVYREHVLIAPGVTLMARSTFKAVIDGGGRGTVVTMSKNTTISGFEIRNGTIGVFLMVLVVRLSPAE